MNRKMLLVGHLQRFANPYVSLYQEEGTDLLFLMLCMKPSSDIVKECLMQQVSAQVVLDYMEGHSQLKQIFKSSESHFCRLASTTGDVHQFNKSVRNPDKLIKVLNSFNEEYCDEGLDLSIFLEERLALNLQ